MLVAYTSKTKSKSQPIPVNTTVSKETKLKNHQSQPSRFSEVKQPLKSQPIKSLPYFASISGL